VRAAPVVPAPAPALSAMPGLRGPLRGLRAGRRSLRIVPQILALGVAALALGTCPRPPPGLQCAGTLSPAPGAPGARRPRPARRLQNARAARGSRCRPAARPLVRRPGRCARAGRQRPERPRGGMRNAGVRVALPVRGGIASPRPALLSPRCVVGTELTPARLPSAECLLGATYAAHFENPAPGARGSGLQLRQPTPLRAGAVLPAARTRGSRRAFGKYL
jgi:hypothetical protein